MREHRKSRRGCLRCKQRKVKCDETLPSCHRCTQRQEICSYITEFGFISSSSAPSSSHRSPTPQSDSQFSSYLIDLDLTHQYLTSTYSTLWGSPEGKLIWRDNIFRMALANPYLLAGLLATAAMHKIAVSETSPVLENIALHKQTEALEGLRLGLQNINAESCDEVFVLSTLVSFWTFASRSLPGRLSLLSTGSDTKNGEIEHESVQSPIAQFIQVLRRVKPLRAVTRESRPWLRGGNLAGLLKMPSLEDLPDLTEDVEHALGELEYQLHQNSSFSSTSTGDLPAFSMRWMFRVSGRPDLSELLVGWPVQLSEQLTEGVKSRDHAALALLGYWAVSFEAMNDRWWSSGWSKAIVLEVSSIVQGPWLELMRWPCLRLGLSFDESVH
ncbi:hypothetical protein B0T10DRAFT_159947 [Thelonectria olida]|uniref:Zn(2)-C6 fungal-type domain-containing protein n=1 Tax=Thelonectria olida TaxID=1576542 RepID=A0A9P8WDK4_9HYPO|nr:hypothetical protein B0T10DRAFT_159947 [Thelonectria olida]